MSWFRDAAETIGKAIPNEGRRVLAKQSRKK